MQLQKLNGIYYVRFKTTKEMCHALMRVQECWESKHWHGRVFSNTKYNKWYRKKYKSTYASEISGLNFPVRAFVPFQMGIFNPLSGPERGLLEWMNDLDYNAYFIATGDDDNAFMHEAAHALYYLKPEYKKGADKILERTDLRTLKKYLKRCDYMQATWLDEAQAFIVDDLDFLEGHDIVDLAKAHGALRRLFHKYWKEIV